MKRLQDNKIALLSNYLKKNGLSTDLIPEILDHLACEAEERLWEGETFEHAFKEILEEADEDSLNKLSIDHYNLLAMEKTLNDIVFENRNKLYGAYDLRKGYNQTVQRSVLLGVTFFLLIVLLPNLYARLVPEAKKTDIGFEAELRTVEIRPEKTLPPPPEPVKVEHKVSTVKYNRFEVLPDNIVPEEMTMPTIDDLADALPGTETVEGDADMMTIEPPKGEVGSARNAIVEAEPAPVTELLVVEQSPEYLGGNAAMSEFLRKNLKYPPRAAAAGVQGRVFVTFVVGTDGKIENVQTLKGIGFGCDEEAERVIKLMPNWKAGRQSGKAVRVRFNMPIVFQME